MTKISMGARKELIQVVGARYRASPKGDRGAILDEFVATTGYHRKHAIRLLGTEPKTGATRKSHSKYGESVRQALAGLWEVSGRVCSKRLKPARIRDAVSLPLIVDADTGFGNALNVRHTVRTLERAGADCIQLEDQVAPKRCGHFSGKEVISTAEAVDKIKAAVDGRTDPDLLIMARTDACAVYGFDAAIERARAFGEAGADLLFVEAVEDADDLRRLPQLLDQPQLMNMVIGGKTPIVGSEELARLGFGIVLYANAALQGAVLGMQKALTTLRETRRLDEASGVVASFKERQRLVGKPEWDALEKRYCGQ